ncbi:MAG: prephenate dehydrogenase/arogenate dehydrogenase family protein [Chloroflexi bacterium]|nr:prephenate dehydrogenase/arogenate dehydrogenase family protein [Chloroflexota bacterium]
MTRVAIIGTGLIGASIGLGLREQADKKTIEIVGYDRNSQRARAAERRDAIDKRENSALAAVADASLVVISTPILAMREVMQEISSTLMPGAVVTDTGSTKGEVMGWARELLPDRVHFVGGHPMAGKTEVGADHADPKLFDGARWVVVPTRQASQAAVETVTGFAAGLGARPMFMDPDEHDAYVAAVSHLPMLAAGALFRLTHDSEAWPELSMLASSGFRDTTRLAGTDEQMAHDIALTNRDQVIHWLQRYRGAIYNLEDQLSNLEGDEELLEWFAKLNFDYLGFKEGQIGRVEIDQQRELPDISITDMFMGGALADRLRQLTDRARETDPNRRR